MIFQSDEIFDFLIIKNKYQSLNEKVNNKNLNQTLKLKKSYMIYPLGLLKSPNRKNGVIYIYIMIIFVLAKV